jgi:adenylate cyclase
VSPLGKGLTNWSYDLPFLLRSWRGIADKDVVVIQLDENSYKELEQKPATFDRSLHARLLSRLKGARMVVFDILFVDLDPTPSAREADQRFATAIRTLGADTKVVLAAEYFDDYQMIRSRTPWLPVAALRNVCAGIGLAEIHCDSDFSARLHHHGTDQIPSLAWKSAKLDEQEVTIRLENRESERWLNYYSRKPFETFRYSDVLSTNGSAAGFSFKNKVVFVGPGKAAGYTGQEKDQYRCPWTWLTGEFVLGVEVHALTFANLARQDWLRRLPMLFELVLIAASGSLLWKGLCRLQGPRKAGVVAVVWVAMTAIGLLLPFSAFWFPWLIIVGAQTPFAFAWWCLSHAHKSIADRDRLRACMGVYVADLVIDEMLKKPATDWIKAGVKNQHLSILFTDIADFTRITQAIQNPEELVRDLNNYYQRAIAAIHEYRGTVLSLAGDSIFAIWNAPLQDANHVALACRAAWKLNAEVTRFNAEGLNLEMRTRVGLHSGEAGVGNLGGARRFCFTAMGNDVNLASRLEGLNKHLGTEILLTESVRKAIQGEFATRGVGLFRLKDFDSCTKVHELIQPIGSSAPLPTWLSNFDEALRHFQRKEFNKASELFKSVIRDSATSARKEGDGVSRFYIRWMQENPPDNLPGKWRGCVDITEK